MSAADTYLAITWGTSRGRDTYGWNICRLRDTVTGKLYRCNGGGYDMVGTVLADWATDVHGDRLLKLASRAHLTYVQPVQFGPDGLPYTRSESPDSLYGLTAWVTHGTPEKVRVDGACGVDSVRRILSAAGIETRHTLTPRGRVTGYMVTLTDGNAS